MGVPAFFRWLSRKYPSIVIHCIEEKLKKVHGLDVPVDATLPNPNEVEFDNLYLDMNGIIHPCCHPEDKPAPETEDDMMIAIFEYIDRIFNIVRPRRVLYMAIDGVAPRAKMNQQRSRRFRSAKESIEKLEDIKRIRQELRDRGVELPPLKPDVAHFDSNCITPGTQFMANLSVCLQYYIHDRMNNNPAWKGIKVILSDANVPGEGEHKIIDYIRRQRASTGHDPNTHHCLYGADADLIMLGLATHEPYFTILREEFKPNQPRPCEICNQYGHNMKECSGESREKKGEFDELATSNIAIQKEFIFIRINILREYLQRELRIDGLGFKFDFERAIDDWVFMCFFVGNDFLPHLPSLQIRENAIDRLIRIYKDNLPSTKSYLTDNGFVNVKNVQLILSELGKVEDDIFRRRREQDKMHRDRQKFKRQKIEDYQAPRFIPEQLAPVPIGSIPSPAVNARHDAFKMRQSATLESNQEAAKSMKALLRKSKSSQDSDNSASSSQDSNERQTPADSVSTDDKRMSRKRLSSDTRTQTKSTNNEEESETEDEVRLWEDGWKERYYQSKFCVSCEDTDFVQQVVESYMHGLCWVMAYYYQGCPSWKWYYPFHYAPFASDFRHIRHIRDKFEQGTRPFRPLEQLMGVFPAASCKFLPPSWQDLMLNEDSPIVDFYPSNFKVDLNGKKFAWQGVALLPFVDEQRLHCALKLVYDTLTPQEVVRNSLGNDYLFIHKYNKLYAFARTLYEECFHTPSKEASKPVKPVLINPQSSAGVSGSVWPNEGMIAILKSKGFVESPLTHLDEIQNSQVICLNFKDPQFHLDYVFESKLLPNVNMPPPTLRPEGMRFGPPGSYQPQIGFAPRNDSRRSYQTPESARRFIRNALSDNTRDKYDNRSSYGHFYQQSFHASPPGAALEPPPVARHNMPGPSFASWTPLPQPDFSGGDKSSHYQNPPRGTGSSHYSHNYSHDPRGAGPGSHYPREYSKNPRGAGSSYYPQEYSHDPGRGYNPPPPPNWSRPLPPQRERAPPPPPAPRGGHQYRVYDSGRRHNS